MSFCTMKLTMGVVMIGDVNIFFNDPDDDSTFGEIEVMIAEAEYRKTGRAREALKLMMGFGTLKLIFSFFFHANFDIISNGRVGLEDFSCKDFAKE